MFSFLLNSQTVFASHNANLFVSAENSAYQNYFAGPMVIEVMVSDPNISDTDEAESEPDVTVNGKILRMVQAVDGNWYGYFADRNQAQVADATSTSGSGTGLDFGTFCRSDTTDIDGGTLTIDISDTVGIALQAVGSGGVQGTTTIAGSTVCTTFTGADLMNVIREEKALNTPASAPPEDGQIDVAPGVWPFIQLYNFNPTGNVVVVYNKGSGAQTTTLTFDTVDQFADLELDRAIYPLGAQVHLTMTDVQLNIDPTDEDSWTWAGDGTGTFYQVFDENGAGPVTTTNDISGSQGAMFFEDNGVFLLTPDAQGTGDVVNIFSNDNSSVTEDPDPALAVVAGVTGLGAGTFPVTFLELSSNSAIFANYDENDAANLRTCTAAICGDGDARRGTPATVDYNETPQSVVIGFDFASIDIQSIDVEWNSGEEIPIVLVDGDANKNSRADEDLDLNNPNVQLIPSLITGNPLTLESLFSAQVITNIVSILSIEEVQQFSHRAILTSPGLTASTGTFTLLLTLSDTYNDLYNSINDPSGPFNGFNFFNYDIRSIGNSMTGGSVNSVDIILSDPTGGKSVIIVSNAPLQGFISLSNVIGDPLFSLTGNQQVILVFDFQVAGTPSITTNTKMPIVADFFSYGFFNEGLIKQERVANQIIRLELEETGDNTSTFEGSLEYVMINQLNILDESTYLGISPIADDPSFIVIDGLTDEDSPRVTYDDLAADGTVLPVADHQDAPSHSGIVSFDLSGYDVGQTVTITLDDKDLNVDSDLIDVFTVVSIPDAAYDTVGKAGLPVFSFGPLGRMMDVTFDDIRWSSGLTVNGGTCNSSGSPDDGLGDTGFTLVETDIASGIFVSNYIVPQTYCNSLAAEITDVNGSVMKVNYVDFRNSLGQITESFDSAIIGEPLEEISFSNLRIRDMLGNIITAPKLDQQFTIWADIQNNSPVPKSYWYFVEIIDTEIEARIPITLNPRQMTSPNSMGICESAGSCVIEAHLYDNMINRMDLVSSLSLILNIESIETSEILKVSISELDDKSTEYGEPLTWNPVITLEEGSQADITLECLTPSNRINCNLSRNLVFPNPETQITLSLTHQDVEAAPYDILLIAKADGVEVDRIQFTYEVLETEPSQCASNEVLVNGQCVPKEPEPPFDTGEIAVIAVVSAIVIGVGIAAAKGVFTASVSSGTTTSGSGPSTTQPPEPPINVELRFEVGFEK